MRILNNVPKEFDWTACRAFDLRRLPIVAGFARRGVGWRGDAVTRIEAQDVIVVGGGLVGIAIACGLARKRASVLVLDEGDIAFRASRGNFGLVWVQSKGAGMPAYARWTRQSSDLWQGFADTLLEETGVDVQFSRPGGYHFCLSPEEFRDRERLMATLARSPGSRFTYEMLDRSALLETFPYLGERVVGASYSPFDGHVNSLRLFRAMHMAFQAAGGRYEPRQAVQGVARDGAGFTVTTDRGRYAAGQVVLAAGNGTRALAPMVGLQAPVSPERGQILVTAKVKPFLSGPTAMLRQTGEGGVLIGDSKEEVGFEDRTTPEVMRDLAARAVTTFPILRDAPVVRSWAALRIMTPDGFPVYQQSETAPGAYVACLHSGVTLAAAHAGPLADAIAEGRLPDDFETFRAERFDVQQAA